MTNNESLSAGTARPDAVPFTADWIAALRADVVASRQTFVHELCDSHEALRAQRDSARSQLAEREADCERLRRLCDDWRRAAESTLNNYTDLVNQIASAAVAPAAREPTTETSEADHV